jgi:hypothetical protein
MQPLIVGVALCLLLGANAVPAGAQEVASSFQQLSVLVGPGDKVTVVDVNGMAAEGWIMKLSRDTLTLANPAGERDIREADVLQIRKKRHDSLKNGAIIGAVASAACFGTMLVIGEAGGFGDTGGGLIVSSAIRGGVFFVGLGAAAGVGIDALIVRRAVIFRKPAGRTTITMSPILGPGRRGAAITVRF